MPIALPGARVGRRPLAHDNGARRIAGGAASHDDEARIRRCGTDATEGDWGSARFGHGSFVDDHFYLLGRDESRLAAYI